MTYDEVIEKINSYIKFGSKLGLARMEKLMQLLGDPQNDMKVIHVAGTNGKGSVCRYLYEILLANGYKTGLYTSPFLERFTERIEADGEEITSQELSACTELVLDKVQELIGMGYESPTEFEVVTAIGFVFFKQKEVQYLVLEVGLGGRGDATNIVKSPLVCVITSISYDHTEYLGSTLPEIAREKAGIVKQGAPVIVQVADAQAKEAIKAVCRQKNAPFYDVTSFETDNLVRRADSYEFSVKLTAKAGTAETCGQDGQETLEKKENILLLDYPDVAISMIGEHQIANAVTALCTVKALELFHGLVLNESEMFRGLRYAVQKGRFEIIKYKPFVIIDGAHNEAGVQALKTVMTQHFAGKKVLTVMGVLEDKITDKLFEDMASFTDAFIATKPINPRAVEAGDLAEKLARTGKPCVSVPDWKDAVQAAMKRRYDYQVVLFAGSLYLIGAVRGELQTYQDISVRGKIRN